MTHKQYMTLAPALLALLAGNPASAADIDSAPPMQLQAANVRQEDRAADARIQRLPDVPCVCAWRVLT